MSELLTDDGCWYIRIVDKEKPWLGTERAASKKHSFAWVASSEFAQQQCTTCGMVKQDGVVIRKVEPVLDLGRPPTEEAHPPLCRNCDHFQPSAWAPAKNGEEVRTPYLRATCQLGRFATTPFSVCDKWKRVTR